MQLVVRRWFSIGRQKASSRRTNHPASWQSGMKLGGFWQRKPVERLLVQYKEDGYVLTCIEPYCGDAPWHLPLDRERNTGYKAGVDDMRGRLKIRTCWILTKHCMSHYKCCSRWDSNGVVSAVICFSADFIT